MRKAFSLVELLIVVLIIGIVYTLAVSSFTKLEENTAQINLLNLREYLQSFEHEKSVRFLCLDDCSSCEIIIDGETNEESKDSFDGFVDDTIEVYRYSMNQGMEQIRDEVFFNSENVEESVCFSYEVDYKGVGEQVFIKFRQRVYDYSSYFESTPSYGTLQEASDFKDSLRAKVIQ